MSYKYVNGVYEVTTEIRPGFRRFHRMNAQCRQMVLNDGNIPHFIVYQFVSYNTDVVQVVRDMRYDSWVVSCNEYPFGYSASTSRQISRWFRDMAFPFDAFDIKEAYKYCGAVTPDLSTYRMCLESPIVYGDRVITIDFHSSYTFHNVWR